MFDRTSRRCNNFLTIDDAFSSFLYAERSREIDKSYKFFFSGKTFYRGSSRDCVSDDFNDVKRFSLVRGIDGFLESIKDTVVTNHCLTTWKFPSLAKSQGISVCV